MDMYGTCRRYCKEDIRSKESKDKEFIFTCPSCGKMEETYTFEDPRRIKPFECVYCKMQCGVMVSEDGSYLKYFENFPFPVFEPKKEVIEQMCNYEIYRHIPDPIESYTFYCSICDSELEILDTDHTNHWVQIAPCKKCKEHEKERKE